MTVIERERDRWGERGEREREWGDKGWVRVGRERCVSGERLGESGEREI